MKTIIFRTKEVIADYFTNTLKSRLAGGSGSRYPQFADADALEAALLNAKWTPFTHPAIESGCTGVMSDIPGEMGMIELDKLNDEDEVKLVDHKNTGMVSAEVSADEYVPVDFTVMITGEHEGETVVFTFHPGNPVQPSTVTSEHFMFSKNILDRRTRITVREAREMGFDYAKITLNEA